MRRCWRKYIWLVLLVLWICPQVSPVKAVRQSAAVVQYQTWLEDLGFYRGPIDGVAGPLTSTAVRTFQKTKGLQVDGLVGPRTLAALRKAWEDKERADNTYTVRKGDTLGGIANRFGVAVSDLCRWNGIHDADLIRPGQKITIKKPPEVVKKKPVSAPPPGVAPPSLPASSPPASPSSPRNDQAHGDAAWECFLPSGGERIPNLRGARVAITFNDGPDTKATGAILDVLARHEVPGTFFLIGEKVNQAPDMARRIAAAGHEIGNHSYGHKSLVGKPLADVEGDLAACQGAIRTVTGHPPTLFRPPGGVMDETTNLAARRQGLQTVFWHNVGVTDDSPLTSEALASAIAARCRDGTIVMLHADRPQTAATVSILVDLLKGAGAQLVTLSELR